MVLSAKIRAGGQRIKKVKGNTLGLKPNQLGRLERLYQRRLPTDQVITPELARALTELSDETGRQIGILVDRAGKLVDVIVGDARQIEISEMGRYRVGKSRFRGLRFLHTHLKGEPVRTLAEFSTILKSFAPGETVQAKLRRGDKLLEKQVKLVAR